MSGRDELLAYMPPILRDVAEACGVAVALKIAEAFGGRRFYIPAEPRAGQPLVEVAGIEAARVLAEWHGGTRPEIPQVAALTGQARARREAILRDDRPHGEVAHALGLSYSHVKKVRRRHRRIVSQRPPDLFS